jgi:hypothetical protein
MKPKISIIIATLLLISLGCVTPTKYPKTANSIDKKAGEAFTFCKQKGFNTSYCFLLDMSIHSGLHRFYIYDFSTNKITDSALVSHGCGTNDWADDDTKTNPSFSNSDGSHLTALGKYKIGKRGWSNWGIHVNYQMQGLEATNSNSVARFIVLHSWEDVSDEEVFPSGTPEGWGCPAVSNTFMTLLDEKLSKTQKPVLLWIYK